MKLDAPSQTTSQAASRSWLGSPNAAPQLYSAGLGRSMELNVAPPSVERKSPASVAARTMDEFAGSTAIDRMLPAGMSATEVAAINWTGADQVAPPSVDFSTDPPCWSNASPVPT